MSVTDADVARAEALARAAARAGQDTDACPYPREGADNRVLRLRWLLAYADTPHAARIVLGGRVQRARRHVRRVAARLWYGTDQAATPTADPAPPPAGPR